MTGSKERQLSLEVALLLKDMDIQFTVEESRAVVDYFTFSGTHWFCSIYNGNVSLGCEFGDEPKDFEHYNEQDLLLNEVTAEDVSNTILLITFIQETHYLIPSMYENGEQRQMPFIEAEEWYPNYSKVKNLVNNSDVLDIALLYDKALDCTFDNRKLPRHDAPQILRWVTFLVAKRNLGPVSSLVIA